MGRNCIVMAYNYTAELLADESERAEHITLVDFGRNDVRRFRPSPRRGMGA